MGNIRTNLDIASETETEQFLSEKLLAIGGVANASLTNDNGFAAKNLPVDGQKGVAR